MSRSPATTKPEETHRCRRCGKDKPLSEFRRGVSPCWRCEAAARAISLDASPARRRRRFQFTNLYLQRRNAVMVEQATRRFARLSDADRAVLLDPAISNAEAAVRLGRTYFSVTVHRSRLWRSMGLDAPIRLHAANKRKYPRATPAQCRPTEARA